MGGVFIVFSSFLTAHSSIWFGCGWVDRTSRDHTCILKEVFFNEYDQVACGVGARTEAAGTLNMAGLNCFHSRG